jgi:hypothetical protein
MNKEHLVACHCKNAHAETIFVSPDGGESPTTMARLEYIDTGCRNDPETKSSWEQISSNSKDFIWTIGCPVYAIGNEFSTRVLLQLLHHGARILKHGGKLVIPLIDKPSFNKLEFMDSVSTLDTEKNWSIEIKEIHDLGYKLTKKGSSLAFDTPLLVLTNVKRGGGRRSRTRKSRQRSRATRRR